MKVWWGTVNLGSLRVSPHTLLVNYKGKYSNFIFEKPREYPSNQMISVSIASRETNQHHVLPSMRHGEHSVILKKELPESNPQETSDIPTLRIIL